MRVPAPGCTVEARLLLLEAASLVVHVLPPTRGKLVILRHGASRYLDGYGPTPAGMPPLPGRRYRTERVAKGIKRIDALAPGSYHLLFYSADRCDPLWATASTEIVPGENQVVLPLRPMGSVRGRVIGPDGRGARAYLFMQTDDPRFRADNGIVLWPWKGFARKYSKTRTPCVNRSGRFFLPRLPEGTWRIRAVPYNPALLPGEIVTRVAPGRVEEVLIRLRTGRPVRVRVGPFDRRCRVRVWGPRGIRYRVLGRRTFRILCPPEETGLTITADSGDRCGRIVIDPGTAEASLEFGEPAVLRGRVFFDDGRPAGAGIGIQASPDWSNSPGNRTFFLYASYGRVASVRRRFRKDNRRKADTDAEGRFGPLSLVPGLWKVAVAGRGAQFVHLAAGEEHEVSLYLPP